MDCIRFSDSNGNSSKYLRSTQGRETSFVPQGKPKHAEKHSVKDLSQATKSVNNMDIIIIICIGILTFSIIRDINKKDK